MRMPPSAPSSRSWSALPSHCTSPGQNVGSNTHHFCSISNVLKGSSKRCRNLDIRHMMLSYKKCPHIYTGGWEVGCNKCVDNKVIVMPKSSPKSMSQIQVPNPSPKFKIQSPEEREWDRGWHYNPTGHHHHPTTNNFSHLKCQYSDGKRPSMTFLNLPWPPMTFHELLWLSMTFYHLLKPLWPFMIKLNVYCQDLV